MNFLATSLVICCALICVTAASQDWINFKVQHGKTYRSRSEDVLRRRLFEQTLERIEKHNSDPSKGYKLGLTKFADWTEAEKQIVNGYKAPAGYHESKNSLDHDAYIDSLINDGKPVPKEVDWRKVPGRVSEIKDQGQCGSCWAFSTTGVLEGQEKTHQKADLTELSEQNLVDCPDQDKFNLFGCQGGIMANGLAFIKAQNGIDDEQSYPYEASQGDCRFNKSNVAFTDSGYAIVKRGAEDKLIQLVAKFGPVAVAIHAADDFHGYKSGVYNGDCSSDVSALNHGVLLVGYGENEKEGKYWIIKNSWGTTWGDDGYIKLSRKRKNMCGLANDATIPKL